jgi:TonB family protein
MLERELFGSFHALQRDRYQSPPFKVGASVSLIVHCAFFVATYTVGISPDVSRDASEGAASTGAGSVGEIVEVYGGRLVMPSPEVMRQLIGERQLTGPARADFISERSSVARGEPNPDPRGSSQLPRSSGAGKEIASVGSTSGQPQPSTTAPATSPVTGEEPQQQRSNRQVTESMDHPSTAASRPTPVPAREQRQGTAPPAAGSGGGPDLAKLGGAGDVPTGVNNQDSAITFRGPISVNARGVGAVEEYRAYLEQAIQRRWQIPPEANLLRQPISLTLEFTIAQDGRLLSVRSYNSTGIRALDRAALQAVQLAAPFRPLPGIFTGPSQVFTDTFVYYPPSQS